MIFKIKIKMIYKSVAVTFTHPDIWFQAFGSGLQKKYERLWTWNLQKLKIL